LIIFFLFSSDKGLAVVTSKGIIPCFFW
jgi:hypothetical protein